MNISRFLFLIIPLCLSNFVGARNYYSSNDSLNKYQGRFFFGAYVGVLSKCSMGETDEKLELNFGYKELVFTGRFYRTWGTQQSPYFYEDSFEAGWRKKFWNGFNNTLSAGYADLAFENGIPNRTIPTTSPENFHKRSGLVLDEKLAYNFHWRNTAPSIWGIAANYYCIFNEEKFVHGWAVGFDFTIDDMYWKNPYTKTKRHTKKVGSDQGKIYYQKNNSGDSIIYRFRIRTNFVTGLLFSPHIDFEHRYSKNRAWGFGFFVRPPFNANRGILRGFNDPDYQLTGAGGFIDWMFFKPIARNFHYWTFGARIGYRYLSGSCAIGGSIYEPDYYLHRERQDFVTAWRVSFVMPPRNSNWSIDWYFTAGARTSFYQTSKFPLTPYWNPEASFSFPKTGCYVLPEFVGGFEFGFGW